ncbi:CU044_5270 family protein [Streptomyces maremycinicus]|uniref:CU044_5270 family protein n=1 Tax=Streptomyces maremycinicus TaxID=1679753 RepID=UPI000A9CE408|nr:CU044_5270 family protein [Streptomyces sp. NBRC 110468]
MDEMTTLKNFRPDAPAADRARLAPGRQRLLDAAAERRQRRRFWPRADWKLAAVGAAAGVAVAAVLVAQVVQVAPTTDTHQVEAEHTTSPEPTDGQWLYEKILTRQSTLNFRDDLNPVPEKGAPAYVELTQETWTQYGSGKSRRMLPSGALDSVIGEANTESPKKLRQEVEKLPSEPQQLLRSLREVSRLGGDYQRIQYVFSNTDTIPSEVRLSLFRALKTIPGVVVRPQLVEDAMGRPALAVHPSDDNPFTRETHRREELLLDPETYEYRGERTMMLVGGMIDSKVTTEETLIVVSAVQRFAAAVNEPGVRP